jgi:ubiquinone/menaquinone biosynthesis C-methylase UbiE
MSVDYLKLQSIHRLKPPRTKRQLPCSAYWAIAQEIVRKTGIREGECLEICGGSGAFGIAMAQITNMNVYLIESSENTINHVAINLKQNGLENRIQLLKGTFQQIPLADHSINLIVCRRSIFKWHSQTKAFQEIYRVLAPGGAAYIGDDSWNHDKWRITENKLEKYEPKLMEQLNGVWQQKMESVKQKIIQAGISTFEMNCNDEGLRIIIHQPSQQEDAS